jgi:fructoselysine-6-P-deglycase FrlB-like protein
MTYLAEEIASQPACWRQAARMATEHVAVLPAPGERVAVVGCGTSWFMAASYAALREALGMGETDAFAASEAPLHRAYDRVLTISRSGTTTEVLELLGQYSGEVPTVAITADPSTPIVTAADEVVVLEFADERSVVQTRFATSTLALLRASLGQDLTPVAAAAEQALGVPVDSALIEAEQVTFLGRGWTVGLAAEAALKLRESCQAWAEAYPAMEYRHGPISIAAPGRVVWAFGEVPAGLEREVADTGAIFEHGDLDPMADLVRLHRLCVARAERLGINPDQPPNLTRSVVLPA